MERKARMSGLLHTAPVPCHHAITSCHFYIPGCCFVEGKRWLGHSQSVRSLIETHVSVLRTRSLLMSVLFRLYGTEESDVTPCLHLPAQQARARVTASCTSWPHESVSLWKAAARASDVAALYHTLASSEVRGDCLTGFPGRKEYTNLLGQRNH